MVQIDGVSEQLGEDVIEEGIDRVFCFLDDSRTCGADCMAYTTRPRRAKSTELAEIQAHCSIITNLDRLGRNISIVGSALSTLITRKKNEEADRKRTGQLDPPAQPTSPFPGR